MTNIAVSRITMWSTLFFMCFYRLAFFELFILYFYIVAYILFGPYMSALIEIVLNFVVRCYKDSVVFSSILFYSILFVLRIAGFIISTHLENPTATRAGSLLGSPTGAAVLLLSCFIAEQPV